MTPAERMKSGLPGIALGLPWALAIGAISGLAAAGLRLGFRGLGWLLTGSVANPPVAAAHLGLLRRGVTPLLGAAIALAILVARRWNAHRLGREPRDFVEYTKAAQEGHGEIPLLPNLWRTASAMFSVSSGAAVGREGSMIQLAAALGSAMDRLRRTRAETEWLEPAQVIACAVAAGVTVAYGAPVAGVCFAVEIVLLRRRWRDVPPLVVAAGAGFAITRLLLKSGPLYPVAPSLPEGGWALAMLPVLAVAMGLLGPVYQRLIRSQLWGLRRLRGLPGALLLGGAAVGALSLLDPRVWGNGDAGLQASLGISREVPIALATLLLLRMSATVICTGVGTVGGVFTPTMFAGAAMSSLLAGFVAHDIPEVSPALWGLVGMSTFVAATTHAPLLAAAITAEMTGDWALFPGLLLLNLLAWSVARTLSPSALYAIASPAPAHDDPDGAPKV